MADRRDLYRGLAAGHMTMQCPKRSPSSDGRIFMNANGRYYSAVVDDDGFHRQPPSWSSEGTYDTEAEAEANLAEAEVGARDALSHYCWRCGTYTRHRTPTTCYPCREGAS